LDPLSREEKISKTDPLPNIDFKQHNSLFITETKSKSKFKISNNEEDEEFNEDLKSKVTPSNYFHPCYNFHKKTDKRIDINNFKEIKSDMKNLFDMKKIDKPQNMGDRRESKSKPLEKNDLKILLESNIQGMALTQSVFERETELNLAARLNLENQEERASNLLEESVEDDDSNQEQDSLKQSFVSFLGTNNEENSQTTNDQTFEKIPDLLDNLKFEKKLNFTDGNPILTEFYFNL
jgi:hypothetical protein